MKKFLFSLFVFATAAMGFSQESKSDKVAKIQFAQEEIDYGTIEHGAYGRRVFEFTNVGNAPLVISNVSTSCGCTTPYWPKEAIAPNAKGHLEVQYDTKRVGPFKKTITIYSNDPTQPIKSLRIKGVILEPKN